MGKDHNTYPHHIVLLVLFTAINATSAAAKESVFFTAHRIGYFRSEACDVADFNNDGDLDIVVAGKWGGPVDFENTARSNK